MTRRQSRRSPLRTLLRCAQEARPAVQIIFALRFVAGAALTGRPLRDELGTLLPATAAWAAVISFAYLFNGTRDVVEDQINGVGRPIARGELDPRHAQRVAVATATGAVLVGLWLGPAFSIALWLALLLGYLYSGPSWALKRAPVTAGLSIIAVGLLTFHAGAVAVTDSAVGRPAAWWIFVVTMSAWMGLVGARAKDLSDVEGDVAAGRRPAAATSRRQHLWTTAAYAVLLGAGAVWACAAFAAHLVPAALTLQAGGLTVAFLTLGHAAEGTRKQRRRPYRAFMMTQYAVHVVVLANTIH